MKICPNCQSGSKDSAIKCPECDTLLTGISPVSQEYLKTISQKSSRRPVRRFLIAQISGLCFLLIYNLFVAYLFVETFGDTKLFWAPLLWYLPGLILFLLPVDRIYGLLQKKRGQQQKHLGDGVIATLRAISIVLLFLAMINMLNVINRTKIPENAPKASAISYSSYL